MLKWLLGIVGLVLGFLVLLIPPILNGLRSVHGILPYIVAVLLVIAGFVAGKVISTAYRKAALQRTEFDVFKLPILSDMKENGWFAMQYEDGLARLSFHKSKPKPNFMIRREK